MAGDAQKILITGAAGFIGQQLARRLLNDISTAYRVVLTDIVKPTVPADASAAGARATCIQADLCSPASLDAVLSAAQPLGAVFVLHGIMSSGSEADPALSARVNLESTRALLEALSTRNRGVRVIYASSQAVYGPPLPDVVTDATTATPASVYGTHKLMCEALVNDMTRRGLIEGFSLRFPSITVRAGKPTAAASSFLSGMFREPLAGQECVIPLRDRAYSAVLCSPRVLIENLAAMLALPGNSLPPHIRALNVPGIAATIQQMIDALAAVSSQETLALLREEPDAETERILRSWAKDVDCSTALKLGLERDKSVEELVREYWKTLDAKAS